jgi:hypothetical protein
MRAFFPYIDCFGYTLWLLAADLPVLSTNGSEPSLADTNYRCPSFLMYVAVDVLDARRTRESCLQGEDVKRCIGTIVSRMCSV